MKIRHTQSHRHGNGELFRHDLRDWSVFIPFSHHHSNLPVKKRDGFDLNLALSVNRGK